jgi:hypothetical protein
MGLSFSSEDWSHLAYLEFDGQGRHGGGTSSEQFQSWIRKLRCMT